MTPTASPSRRRWAHLASGTALAVAVTLGVTAPASAAPSEGADAQSTATYLEHQLSKNDYTLPGSFSPTDWGLTIDALFALAAIGGHDDTVEKVAQRVQADGWDYLQYSCYSDIGSFAKVSLALQIGGGDPTRFDISKAGDFGDYCSDVESDGPHPAHGAYPGGDRNDTLDLVGLVREEIRLNDTEAAGVNRGRAGHVGTNHFDQTLAVLTLARTDEGVPAVATSYLAAHQCLDESSDDFGGLGYSRTEQCGSVDGDATGFMLSGLVAAGKKVGDAVVDRAITWMKNRQADDGSFPASWSGQGNSNSAGLVGNVARQLGTAETNAIADRTDAYLRGLLVGPDDVVREGDDATQPGFARQWAGAIAYDADAFDSAKTQGIQGFEEDQWRRATTQAVLGLAKLPGWSDIPAVETKLPAKQLTVSSNKRPTAVGTTVPVTATGLAAGEKYTVALSGTQVASGTASATGAVSTSFTIPKAMTDNAYRKLVVTGSQDDRTGSVRFATVAAKKLTVKLSATKVKAGKKLTIRVSGLMTPASPGLPEKLQVRMSRRSAVDTYAGPGGVKTVTMTVPRSKGTTYVRVSGASTSRTAVVSFKVV